MRVLALLTICLRFGSLSAQPLYGVVYDAHTHQAIGGAQLSLSQARQSCHSDSSGRYRWSALPSGTLQIMVAAAGYLPSLRSTYVQDDVPTLLNVALNPAPYSLLHASLTSPQSLVTDPLEAMVPISQLSAHQWEAAPPRSSPEALPSLAEAWLVQPFHAGGAPVLRGLSGRNTLITFDDIRLNHSAQGPGTSPWLSLITPGQIAQLSYQPAGSATHGSDALGGSLHLSAPPPTYLDSGHHWQRGAQFMALSQNLGLKGRFAIERRSERQVLQAAAALGSFGDRVSGKGGRVPGGYDEQAFDFAWHQRLGSSGELQLAYLHTQQRDAPAPLLDDEARRYDLREHVLAYLRWTHHGARPWAQRLRLTTSARRYLSHLRSQPPDSLLTQQQDDWQSLGWQIDLSSQPRPGWDITSGMTIMVDLANSQANALDSAGAIRRSLPSRYGLGGMATQWGLFTEHRWQLGAWRMLAGLRYQGSDLQVGTQAFGDQQLRPSAWGGQWGLMRRINQAQRLSARVALGFRNPNLYDLSETGSTAIGILVPVSHLHATYALSSELTYQARWEQVALRVGGYHSWLLGLMEPQPSRYRGEETYLGQPVYRLTNAGGGRVLGATLQGEWRGANLCAYGHATYTWGIDRAGMPMTEIPPLFGLIGLRYAKRGFWVALEGQAAASQGRLSAGEQRDPLIPEGGSPAWLLLHAKGGWQWHWLRLSLTFHNLTDQAYRPHGSLIQGYGRSAWVSLTTSF
jgi:hypothetical protein